MNNIELRILIYKIMILNKEINIKGNSRNVNHFKKLGYDIKVNELIKVKIKDLLPTSHIKIEVECDICNTKKEITYHSYIRNLKTSKNNTYTCQKCCIIKNKETCIEKYGVEFPMQSKDIIKKRKENNLKKYGVDEPAKLKEISDKAKRTKKLLYSKENYNNSEKMKKTKFDKYGDSSYNNSEKIKKTCIEKYGVDNVFKTSDVQKKKKKTTIDHYGVDNYKKSEQYKIDNRNYILKKFKNYNIINYNNGISTLECDKGHTYDIDIQVLRNRISYNTIICTVCNPINSYSNSGYEKQLYEFIKDNYNEEIILNDRKTIKKEIDIYLPNDKMGFEFNGLYWHSEINIPSNYHKNKTDEANKNNIKLVHIYEDDWIYKQDIVKSRILNLLGKSNKIYARKCVIKEITDNILIRNFLEKNHLQSFVGSKVKLGLFYNNELVSLMTFGSLRKSMGKKSNKNSYEMLRFCNKLNTRVIGGASRLFKYFVKNYNPEEIISYADRSWPNEKLYEKLNFKIVGITKPNYYYIVDGIRKYRFNFRKDILVKEGADPDKTEHEIMLERGIYRIYDSGHLKYVY